MIFVPPPTCNRTMEIVILESSEDTAQIIAIISRVVQWLGAYASHDLERAAPAPVSRVLAAV